MPEYSYSCSKCKNIFTTVCSIREYQEKINCPECFSLEYVARNYFEDLNSLNASIKKSDNELKTIGDLANRNRDKMSNDHKVHLQLEHNKYKEEQSTKELPKGMSRLSKPNFKYRWT